MATDKKSGDGKDGILVTFDEFLRKVAERDAAGPKNDRPSKTPEEMVVQMGMLLGLVVNAHDALLELYKMQANFMVEHMDLPTLESYIAGATPLQDAFAQKIKLLLNPPFL